MDGCIFCKIVKGEIPCFKIFEDENFLAFLDISQFTPGHTLVIPKTHYRFVWDHPQIGEYYSLVQKIAAHYQKLGYKYVDSLVFGRMMPHAHVHLVPHNEDQKDYQKFLHGLDEMIADSSRHPDATTGDKLVAKFKLI